MMLLGLTTRRLGPNRMKHSKRLLLLSVNLKLIIRFGSRIRRGALSPIFSRKMVLDLEHVVQDKAQKLSEAVKIGIESGKSVNL